MADFESKRNQLNAMLRDRAYSAGTGIEEIPELYGLQQELRAPGGIDQQLEQQQAPQLQQPGSFGGDASGVGAAAAPTVGYAPQQEQEPINALSSYMQPNYDNGDTGRGGDAGYRDTSPSPVGPQDEFDEAMNAALGFAPGPFGAFTGFTQAMTAMGVPGVNTSQPPPMEDRAAFAAYMDQVRAAEAQSRAMHDAENFSVGTDVFGDFDMGGFEQGYGQPEAPAPGPAVGGYDVGGYAVGGGLSHSGPTGSSFGAPTGSLGGINSVNDHSFGSGDGGAGGQGSPGGGSGGHGGQAGEGAGSGNSAGGGRGDSEGYHDGGIISDADNIQGEELTRKVLEGEGVLTREAVSMLGPDTVLILNELARRRMGSDKSTPNGEA